MTAASRRGAILGVVAVAALVAGLSWFVLQDEPTPQDLDVIGSGDGGHDQPPVFQQPRPGAPERVQSPTDDGGPVVVEVPTVGDPELQIAAGPVVAVGSVTWPAGFGVESVEVILYDADGFEVDLADTDGSGRFELRYDEPLSAGWGVGTEARVVDWGGTKTYLLPAMCSELATHIPGEPAVQCDLRLGFAPTLSGRVTSRADGGPLADAEVYVASTLRPWSQVELSTRTAEDGTYLLPMDDLPTQDVIVWFLEDEHQAQLIGPMNLEPVSVPGELVRVDAALDAASSIRGHVFDARNNLPIEGVMVTAGSTYSVFSRAGDWDITGDEGEFELDTGSLPPFGSWLLATADGYGPAVVFPDSPAGSHEIHLGPIQSIDGHVIDAISGKPIEDADIMFAFVGDTWELDHGLYDEEYSGADGRFTLELSSVPVGGARVRVVCDDYAPLDVPFELVATRSSGNTWSVLIRLTSL